MRDDDSDDDSDDDGDHSIPLRCRQGPVRFTPRASPINNMEFRFCDGGYPSTKVATLQLFLRYAWGEHPIDIRRFGLSRRRFVLHGNSGWS
jgi:hypothetical protein